MIFFCIINHSVASIRPLGTKGMRPVASDCPFVERLSTPLLGGRRCLHQEGINKKPKTPKLDEGHSWSRMNADGPSIAKDIHAPCKALHAYAKQTAGGVRRKPKRPRRSGGAPCTRSAPGVKYDGNTKEGEHHWPKFPWSAVVLAPRSLCPAAYPVARDLTFTGPGANGGRPGFRSSAGELPPPRTLAAPRWPLLLGTPHPEPWPALRSSGRRQSETGARRREFTTHTPRRGTRAIAIGGGLGWPAVSARPARGHPGTLTPRRVWTS